LKLKNMTKRAPIRFKSIARTATISFLLFATFDAVYAQTSSTGSSSPGAPAKIFLNPDEAGTTVDPSPLFNTLKERFQQRKEQHAYAFGKELRVDLPESERIERTVFVSAPPATAISEVAKLIAIVKGTEANPVQLPIKVEPAILRRSRTKSNWFVGPTFKPQPLILVVSLNQPDDYIYKPIAGGISVSLLGPMAHLDGSAVKDNTLLVVNISKDGAYVLDGKPVAKTQLENVIRNRMKAELPPDRALLINPDSNMAYASAIDVAYAAKAAGASLVFLPIGAKKIEWQEQGTSFVLPEYWTKDGSEQGSQTWKGTDAEFSIYFGERLEDSVPQRQFQEMYDRHVQTPTGKPFEITDFVEVDGVKGLLTSTEDDEIVSLNWIAFRPARGKFQFVSIRLAAPREGFKHRQYELYAILNSISLAHK
jgi:biopolymer transport protein ExbD